MIFLAHGILAATLLLSGCAQAQRVTMTIRDADQSRPLPVHSHRGADYIEGQPGQRYAIHLANHSGARVLVVVSVDGVNVVTGQTASPDQAGYVLGPWQEADIEGWRKSLTESAAFRFSALESSYAARTGRPEHVGVIGVAVFDEALPRWREEARAQEAPAPSAGRSAAADSAVAAQQLGTAHAERRFDPVETTQFERASTQPVQIQQVFYDSAQALAARGIISSTCCSPRQPNAFPLGFVPDPP